MAVAPDRLALFEEMREDELDSAALYRALADASQGRRRDVLNRLVADVDLINSGPPADLAPEFDGPPVLLDEPAADGEPQADHDVHGLTRGPERRHAHRETHQHDRPDDRGTALYRRRRPACRRPAAAL